ncbi:hypothetical protein chiPu_0026784, partial [Chiloscyllium punctatum]|nr:hypothetical protein [Chiloscyllium punctatum]
AKTREREREIAANAEAARAVTARLAPAYAAPPGASSIITESTTPPHPNTLLEAKQKLLEKFGAGREKESRV